MTNIWIERKVKVTRNEQQCLHCLGTISVGEPALTISGVWEGDFQFYYTHIECMAAAQDYVSAFLEPGDNWPWLHELKREDLEALRPDHPVAIGRIDRNHSGTHGSAELDEDAAKLMALGQDPGSTLEDLDAAFRTVAKPDIA